MNRFAWAVLGGIVVVVLFLVSTVAYTVGREAAPTQLVCEGDKTPEFRTSIELKRSDTGMVRTGVLSLTPGCRLATDDGLGIAAVLTNSEPGADISALVEELSDLAPDAVTALRAALEKIPAERRSAAVLELIGAIDATKSPSTTTTTAVRSPR